MERLKVRTAITLLAGAGTLLNVACSTTETTDDGPLAGVSFMQGSWTGELNGGRFDEVWTEPAGGNMTGMFRWFGDDGVFLYELMSIDGGDDSPMYVLRHFDAGLAPWASEANGPMSFDVTVPEPRVMVLSPRDPEEPTVTYDGRKVGEVLVTVQGTEAGPLELRLIRND